LLITPDFYKLISDKGYNYGTKHTSDSLIVPIPQSIRDKYESWRECGTTAQIVIKKEAI